MTGEYETISLRYWRVETSNLEQAMRRLILSLAVAAIVGTGLTAALPTPAHAEGEWGYYHHDGGRERAWREYRWHEWAWRHRFGHEWHESHFDH